ncbi:ferredoxin, 2Fe-2S [Faunimonas pinastri]|uniref:Ferredoxin, 2Fe-2S n=1 Tax=Faunimonas pinastri TaxID=1855383 RepID=A0A1H9LX44_9HYPH|nr:2Fe-2S iron-sulfur cluster-binding protein [Faunimonas pinastri]SER16000.1 ferredoxin, 2Fe-2S [Faunimonas pinastri]
MSAEAVQQIDYAEGVDAALVILVNDQDGVQHRLPAEEGWRVMEVIRDWGLNIKAECGGACACATCHVHVAPVWKDQLPAPTDEEIDRLDDAFDVTDDSRLSCQILVTPELNGLEVSLAPGTER